MSVSRSQNTPRERWAGKLSWRKSKLRTSFARSSVGKASITLTEFDTTLWSLRFALARAACVFLTSVTTSSAVGFDTKPSST